jgi:hypothetical protein
MEYIYSALYRIVWGIHRLSIHAVSVYVLVQRCHVAHVVHVMGSG